MRAFAIGVLFSLMPFTAVPLHVQAPAARVNLHTAKVATVIGEVNYESLEAFETEFILTAKVPGDRVILIDSPGGSVEIGEKMLKLMENEQLHGIKQICVVLHDASSMAFNILTRCDVRLSLPMAHMLMHKAAVGAIDCQTQRCTAEKLREVQKDLDQVDEPYRRANAKALKMRLDDYDVFADAEHVWTVEALIKRGYLVGIATVDLDR